ncbi:MAG: restriction endonuclease subunit S [Rectinemataceae bacterium]|jgi:type I restriction enzyme S subunit
MRVAEAEWKPSKLDELGFVGRGKSRHRPRNAAFLYGGPYPFFQTGDIKAASFHLSAYTQTYNEEGLAQSKLWKPGTLCITIAANIAESAILSIEGCFPDSVVGFVADPEKADVRFIKYYLEVLKFQMQSVSRGTTQDNLSLEKLLSFDFLVPPLPVQQRIAGILSAYDELIENGQRRIRILETMARALYREWFVQFRFPGHEKVKMVQSPLGEIPEGWEICALGDLVQFKSGFAFKSSSFTSDGGHRLVTIRNVQDGTFNPESDSRMSELPEKLPEYCVLDDGAILLSLTGNVGRVCLVYDGPFLLNQRVSKLVPAENFDWAMAYCMFREPEMRVKLEQLSNGVAQQNLSPVLASKMEFVRPPRELRQRFAALAEPLVCRIVQLYSTIQNLGRTRDLLLPRLLSRQAKLEN